MRPGSTRTILEETKTPGHWTSFFRCRQTTRGTPTRMDAARIPSTSYPTHSRAEAAGDFCTTFRSTTVEPRLGSLICWGALWLTAWVRCRVAFGPNFDLLIVRKIK